MSEFRQNPITKAWVLIAPKRSQRPEDYKTHSVMSGMPELDPVCVFCPGDKESLNKELFRTPQGSNWDIRVVDNKFHALDETKVYRHKEFYTSLAGHGDHEVLITRKHNEPVALQSVQTIALSLQTFIDRTKAITADPAIAYVQVFHNH